MSLIPHFAAQRSAFEAAYDNGDWHSVGAFFHTDIVYEVMNMPFHCVVSGRSAVLAGFERSIERFDKKCKRTVGIGSAVHEEGANVLGCVDKRDSQSRWFLIQDCFLESSHGTWGFVGRRMGAGRAAVAV